MNRTDAIKELFEDSELLHHSGYDSLEDAYEGLGTDGMLDMIRESGTSEMEIEHYIECC